MDQPRKLVYKFQPKDSRDHMFKTEPHPKNENLQLQTTTIPLKSLSASKTVTANPATFILSNTAAILDQGNLGDCVSNAFSFAVTTQTKTLANPVYLSRIFMYDICRILDNNPLNVDSGTTIRTACSSIKNYGFVSEGSYPYNIKAFSNFPPLATLKLSKQPAAFSYTFVTQDLTSIKNCLNTYKVPIVFGFLVYSSFMTAAVAKTGTVPMPNIANEMLEGGHCMCIIGYDDVKQSFTCVNSWGTSWGNKGFCYIPYNYLMNTGLASDFCFISQLTP